MYSNNPHKISATEKKRFFNAAANGLIDVIVNQISKKPELLKVTNLNSNNLGIYYSIKNRHLDVTILLYENGQRFIKSLIRNIINTSKSPEKDYVFLIKLYNHTNFEYEGKNNGIYFEDYLFDQMKLICYSNNMITSLELLFREKGIEPNWSEILTEYKIYKNIDDNTNNNSKTIQFIRDLTLKCLLNEEL